MQTAGQATPPQPEERSTGLPLGIHWNFNFDAGWGSFGFGNSLHDNPKEPVPENLSDPWFEGYVKPALPGSHRFASTARTRITRRKAPARARVTNVSGSRLNDSSLVSMVTLVDLTGAYQQGATQTFDWE